MPDSASHLPTARTTATRHRDRMTYDRATARQVLDEALVSHVGFVVDGRPVVLPQLHVRVGEVLYLHGSTGARAMRIAAGGGLDVCVTVTLLDALVLARSAFHHSMNYRSVVVHGRAQAVSDVEEKVTALEALVEHIAAGRTADIRSPSGRELAATALLRLPLQEVSVKTRTGGPVDDGEDLALPHWAGLLPLSLQPGMPEPAPDLAPSTEVPNHVRSWSR